MTHQKKKRTDNEIVRMSIVKRNTNNNNRNIDEENDENYAMETSVSAVYLRNK